MTTSLLTSRPKPVVLAILDGWGHAENGDKAHNAIFQANTPHLDALAKRYPISFLDASEKHVGLPGGQMGNSEVGHMNIGGGRIVMQDLPRIDAAIADGSLAKNPALRRFIEALKKTGGACHLMGLLSPGGVHAHQDHMAYLARVIAGHGVRVWVHAFLDGRDTPPKSALGYIQQFNKDIQGFSNIRFVTVSGRYFAMDRDKRWDRVQRAYEAMMEDEAGDYYWAADPERAVIAAYDENINSDEFILPGCIGDFDYKGMKDGDGLLMANFRADRAREILTALLDPEFKGFERKRRVKFAGALGMVEYSTELAGMMEAMFAPQDLNHSLGEVVAEMGLKQLRIAETEKYAHVTFFFNGGREEPFAGEERILVPSPKVATYDLQPEMSAPEVTDRLVEAIEAERFDLIVVNYANTDMVGHTGDIEAAKKAVEAVDTCVGRVWAAVEKKGGVMAITADHGNAEMLHDPVTGQAHTAHTLNRVPFTLLGKGYEKDRCILRNGVLADIAPTLLPILRIPIPLEMTGKNLLERHAADDKAYAV